MAYPQPPLSGDPHVSPQYQQPTKASATHRAWELCFGPLPAAGSALHAPKNRLPPPRTPARSPADRRRRRSPPARRLLAPCCLQVIHLRNLPFDITPDELKEFAMAWGPVVAVKHQVGGAGGC